VLFLLGGGVWLLASGRLRIPFLRPSFWMTSKDEEVSPYERLLAEAATLQMHLTNSDHKKFFNKLYLIIRSLINIKASEDLNHLSTSEVLGRLENIGFTNEERQRIGSLLEQCEVARFSDEEASIPASESLLRELRDILTSLDKRFRKERRRYSNKKEEKNAS